MIFVITQMHGLSLSRKLRGILGLIFAGAVVYSYYILPYTFKTPDGRIFEFPLTMIMELIRIPTFDYGFIFVLYLVWYIFTKIVEKLASIQPRTSLLD